MKLERHMSAVRHKLSLESTDKVDEDAFCEIRVAKKNYEEALCKRSRKARLKTACKSEDEARQHDALYQRWYDWLKTAKRRNVDREHLLTKWLIKRLRCKLFPY